MHEPVLAVDLGGTQMRAAVVAEDGTARRREPRPTPVEDPAPDALLALIVGVLASAPARRAVFAVPGVVDYRRGCLGLPVSLANDADCAAVGEATFGAGRDYRDVASLTVSTGIGSGVLLGGRLVTGRLSAAEIGHTVIDLVAETQGRPPTLEQLGSGTARADQAAAVGLPADGEQLVALVRAGDRQARQVWDRVVGRSGEVLLAPIRIVGADLGDHAGLGGAAGWQRAATGRYER